MSVVQRCPNCGTTKATSGECEACHEADVRYFCTNHTPGLWLSASACPKCGARFGEPARRPSAPAPAIPVRPRSTAPASAGPRRTRSPAPPRASAAPTRPEPGPDAWGTRMRPRPAYDDRHDRGAAGMALLQQLLRAAMRSRYMPHRTARYRGMPRFGRGAGGCLKRLLLSMVFLFIALAGAAFVFGRALLGY